MKGTSANSELKNCFAFLTDLADNNERDWLLANKDRQKEAQDDFKVFVADIYEGLLQFDASLEGQDPSKSIFRIYRDVRFSKDKRPYKTNFGVFLKKGGKKSPYSGYYFHLEPGKSFAAGGLYMPPGETLQKVRQEIDYNGEEFRGLLKGKFEEYFGELQGDKLKRPPRGYSEDNPMIDLLKHKSFLMMHNLSDKEMLDNGLKSKLMHIYAAMTPLNTFLNRAMD